MFHHRTRPVLICSAVLSLCLGALPAFGQFGTAKPGAESVSRDVLAKFKADPGIIQMRDLISSYEAGGISQPNAALKLQDILEKRRIDKLAVPPLDLVTRLQLICPECTTTDPFPGTPQPIGGPIGPIGGTGGGPTGPIGGTPGGGTPGGGGPR